MINWKSHGENRVSEEIFEGAFKDTFTDQIKNGAFCI